jgi:hypothetical protein
MGFMWWGRFRAGLDSNRLDEKELYVPALEPCIRGNEFTLLFFSFPSFKRILDPYTPTMSLGRVILLNTGAAIPQIGLGTCSNPTEMENAVRVSYQRGTVTSTKLNREAFLFSAHKVDIAIRNGYRHLDLAMVYRNQDEVGRALKKVIPSVVSREQLFITSKLWNSSHHLQVVEAELDETLKQLGLTYLDLYREHIHKQPERVLVNESRDCSCPLACSFRSREWSLPAQVRWRGTP